MSLHLSSDNSYLISWDLDNGIGKTLDGHSKKVKELSMITGNEVLILKSSDGKIKISVTKTGICKRTFRLNRAVMAIELSQKGD